MNQIAVQPYYKVERKIDGQEQQHWIDERMLVLYQDSSNHPPKRICYFGCV